MMERLTDTVSWAEIWLQQPKKQYINGAWINGNSGEEWQVKNPANGDILCCFEMANAEQIEEMAKQANAIHESKEWAKTASATRAKFLNDIAKLIRDHRAEFAVLESLPNGKLYNESYDGDIPTCADIFEYYAGWTDKFYGENCPVDDGFLNFTTREPIGVCGLIAPWNFPLYQASLKLAPALAMGNPVILKPSEYTPLTAIYLIELIDKHLNPPKGLINLLLTNGIYANHLTLSDNVHKVSFTGSTAVGRKIVANSSESNLKTTTLELGGKSPCIFFADTPKLDASIDRAFEVMFSCKGEKCSEPTRFIIHESIYDYVLERLITKANAVKCGSPFDPKAEQGPQCNETQFNKIMEYIEIGKNEAELVAGGYRDVDGNNKKGFFIRPTIFSKVNPKARIAQEEIFGPVLSCISFSTVEEAISIANDSAYGLAAGIYTSDISLAHHVAERIDAGMLFINRYGCYGLSSPFGGFKQSGWGKEMAHHSLSSYTKVKSVWVSFGEYQ